jgi:hypothetical protein
MWTPHKVIFELLSPLHAGHRKIGNLADTRCYLPGRAIWGALTSRITRDGGHHDYAEIGKRVREELAWSYFFPSTNPGNVSLWPWGKDRQEFEWLYLGSFASTALEDGHTADEGTLHEVEYIAPRTRSGKQVYLSGYIFERDGSSLGWRHALDRLQVGGERSYGWGRLRLLRIEPYHGPSFGIYTTHTDTERPAIEVSCGQALAAHTLAADAVDYEGTVEPLVGHETEMQTAQFGASLSSAVVCWIPGTRTLRDHRYRIGPYGVWEAA